MLAQTIKTIRNFEFNDSPSCPQFIRESIQEILGQSIRDAQVYQQLAPYFVDFCQEAGIESILEIGAGSGQSTGVFVDAVLQTGHTPPKIYISDLFPLPWVMAETCKRYPGVMIPIQEPMDIRNPDWPPLTKCALSSAPFTIFSRKLSELSWMMPRRNR